MNPPDEEHRQRLASDLRTLRTSTGLTATQLAERLGWSQSKVSKTELGQTRPKPSDVEAWALATDADDALRKELVGLANEATIQFTEWRREHAPGRRRVQEEVERLESEASTIRVFGMEVIPGLAQTKPYVEAMFQLGQPPPEPAEISAIVQARQRRQQILTDTTKMFVLLMSEMAIRRSLLRADQMRNQLEHLIQLSKHGNITIGIIPFTARETEHQYHGYAILGDPETDTESLVMTESLTRPLNIRAPQEVAQYVQHFEALHTAALDGKQVRKLLREVITQLDER